jgi:hypothetical protein
MRVTLTSLTPSLFSSFSNAGDVCGKCGSANIPNDSLCRLALCVVIGHTTQRDRQRRSIYVYFSVLCERCAPVIKNMRSMCLDIGLAKHVVLLLQETANVLLEETTQKALSDAKLTTKYFALLDMLYERIMEECMYYYDACMYCDEREAHIMCELCDSAWYCSEECKTKNLERHVDDCHLFQARKLWMRHLTSHHPAAKINRKKK